MLIRFAVSGVKSLADVAVTFPQLTVLFGPNAAGKSNLLDAVQALSRIGTSRTLSDALAEPIRGYPIEAFGFPPGGLSQLLNQDFARFKLEADVQAGRERFRCRVAVEIQPKSGSVVVRDEHLVALGAKGEPKGTPSIEREGEYLLLRRKSHPGRPRNEPVGQDYAMLSDQKRSTLDIQVRQEGRAFSSRINQALQRSEWTGRHRRGSLRRIRTALQGPRNRAGTDVGDAS